MAIIVILIWFILSIYTIYYVDHYYYWNQLSTILIVASILALLFNTWQIYDSKMNHITVTIETNPTWNTALYLALIEGVCITGPIAGLHILKEKIKERRG